MIWGEIRGRTFVRSWAAIITILSLLVQPRLVKAQVLMTFDEHGEAHTPLARGALQISAQTTLERRFYDGAERLVLNVGIETTNSALTDTGVGCVRVGLLRRGTMVSSFLTCSEENPARVLPFARPSRRRAFAEHLVPDRLRFDSIGFRFFNRLHGGEGLDWVNVAFLGARVALGR